MHNCLIILCLVLLVGFASAAAPVASFTNSTTTPREGIAPLAVQFNDTSSNTPTGWAWFFGDENFTAPWTEMNASPGWSARGLVSSVAMPDGSIVLTGGFDGVKYKNDTWRSTDNGATWTQLPDAGWSARSGHSSVVMPDGSIVLTGGLNSGGVKNDVWRSTDKGATWTRVIASPGWSARYIHSSVAMPDGSIVLMGGQGSDYAYLNDTWRSTDNGATWTEMNASPGWSARYAPTSVAMPDGSIVLLGGYEGQNLWKNDTWRSTDNGATWIRMNASAGWTARFYHSSVAMADGSIVLTGGMDGISDYGYGNTNDVWRSTDKGATWTQLPDAGWTARYFHSSVAMPDGSIVLMGGYSGRVGSMKNDTWRFMPAGSSAQNPSHTYTTPGNYKVSLVASNAGGSNTTTKVNYINISASTVPLPVANFTNSTTTHREGIAPLAVQFNDTSSNTPTGWAWFFGDENFTAPWTEMNASSGWTIRYMHSSVAMPDGSIVLMGGGTGYLSYKNDTWRSTDNGVTWTLRNASSGWTERIAQSSVAMPDGSIVLMGGYDGGYKNDTWRSTDNGATWTLVNGSSGWSVRGDHTSVVMRDGSIVLMGGVSDGFRYKNDTWRSTDNGITWTQQTASAGWSARGDHTSVAMPDGSIVLMGGINSETPLYTNDTWRSTDNGATWTQQTASAGWTRRSMQRSVAMPDGSIVLMGGVSDGLYKNDMWRSTDNGATWTLVNGSSGWSVRTGNSVVAMRDGSIVLMGGYFIVHKNDVWRFMPASSSAQNPSHTYTTPGIYSVALQVYNIFGYNSTRKAGYINVSNVGNVGGLPDVMFRYNANHSGDYSPVAGTTTTSVSQLWNRSIGYTGAALDSSPVVSDGVVYIGSGDKNLYAINAATGALLWNNLTGNSIASSPAVSNGTVYFGSTDTYVYALNASTGAKVWTYNTSPHYIYSSPVIANSTVYISDDSWLHAFNATTGAQLWSKQIGTNIYSTPAIANDVVYIGSDNSRLFAIGATNGTQLWANLVTDPIISSPSVINGIVYFSSGNHVYAWNASTGVPIWNFNDPNGAAWYSASPAVTNGVVYVAGGSNNILRALDASTGAYVWNYTASSSVHTPSVANGIVYFGCNDNNICALNASTGAPYWTFPTGGFVNDAPSIANGVLYIASQDGKLYALDISGAAPVPSVTNVSPSSGPTTGGDMVTITGTGFTGATAITFGGTSAWPPSSISDTTILVASPAHAAGTVDVTVTTIRGTSATGSADRFTYTSVPLPSAGFVGTPLSGLAPLTVTFNDTSTGTGIISWNWTFGDGSAENSTMQNPVHTYLNNGTYSVTLNVTNASGSNNLTKSHYIIVGSLTRTGVFRGLGYWYLDMNNNGTWDGTPTDKEFYWGKFTGDNPMTGDWNGDGVTETGIFRAGGHWYLDMNNNGTWDNTPTDKEFYWGKQPGDIPMTGDWNGDQVTETGIFRAGGHWYLDMNNNGTWDGTPTDKEFYWGKFSGDIPITGDWNGDRATETGIFRPGTGFYLDMNNNGTWDNTPTDKVFYWVTQPGDIPITGDWTGDGITKIGIFRPGIGFYLDMNNNGQYDGPSTDKFLPWGLQLGDKPITGRW